MTKYDVPDDYWERRAEAEEEAELDPVDVETHEIDVVHTRDPEETMGYGRDKYTAHITHDHEDGMLVLFVTKHRWKGNFWRETRDLDWRDVPLLVRRRVASVLAVDVEEDLEADHRLVDEGGEQPWQARAASRETDRQATEREEAQRDS